MAEELPIPILAPLEALRYFRGKGFSFGFAWQDVWQDEHARAFTVAKAMTRDVLETIRAAVDSAIADGTTFETFKKDLQPKLEDLGWWGRKSMIDPLTAQAKTVQLGSPRRLQTIFNANLRTSYQAGRWERIDRQKKAFPFLRYVHSDASRNPRPEHLAWDGTVLPVDDVFWDTHYGPCGWGCKCTAAAYNQRMLDKRGYVVTETPASFPTRTWTNKRTGEVHEIEQGIDPGWSYNVGKAHLAALGSTPMPGSFDGADIAAAGAAAAAIAPFFAVFGLKADAARAGKVFTDPDGWPLAVSLAWFEQGGRLVLPAPARRSSLGMAARTIAKPTEIRWVWVRGVDGSAMLMRRYLTIADGVVTCAVDVGRAGWRFLAVAAGDGPLGRLRNGFVAWRLDLSSKSGDE